MLKNVISDCRQTRKQNGVVGISPFGAKVWIPANVLIGARIQEAGVIHIEFEDFDPGDGIIFVKGLTKVTNMSGDVIFESAPKLKLDRIRGLVDSAVAAGAKRIKFRLDRDVEIKYCGPRSKYHGKLAVNADDHFCGFIDLDGSWAPRKGCSETVDTVLAFNADPAAWAKLSAAHTGSCCFCGRFLENDGSIEAGYGPVCASKFGLPWKDHAEGSIELTEDEKASLPAAQDPAADREREAVEAY